jgi:LCP family protein required for cell wall assembly
VAGNSADDVGHNGAELTDSIMIISIDTKNKRAFTMSVPRDLWVDIPNNGHAKINEVYQDGEEDGFSQTGYAEGGMGLLQKVIGENFGMSFQYYALVNYTAFKDAVDAVGGIDVNIQSEDSRGLYDPSRDWTGPRGTPLVKLPNGANHLTGQQALNLARARGNAYGAYGYGNSDFTRTANQRLMLVALKEKSGSAGVALNPIKLASLMDSFGNNVVTDFKTTELRRLLDLSKQIPSGSIVSAGLNDIDGNGKNLLKSCQYSCRGQSALVPATGLDDYTDIQAYVETLLAPPPAPAPASNTRSGQ